MSLLGRLFARGLEGDDIMLRPSRKFTKQDIMKIAERGASGFRADAMNVLSCYELEGEFGLYSTIGNYVQTKNPMTAEINEALVDGDEIALIQAFRRSMELAFVSLVEKDALRRLQLSQWPTEAIAEYARMRKSVSTATAASPAPVAAPVAPPRPIDPVEECVADWNNKQVPSNVFKKKWMDHRDRRPYYDRAIDQGLIA
jgi:hypothetical protein